MRRRWKKYARHVPHGLAGATVIGALYAASQANYLLFHSLVELFSVAVAFSIFMLVWNARQFLDDDYPLFIGVGLGCISLVDLLHTLAYQGMGVFSGYLSPDLATQLWIVARYLQAAAFLFGALLIGRKYFSASSPRGYLLLAGWGGTAGLLTGLIFLGGFPACYVENRGLTLFKILSEYLIVGMLAAALYLLWNRRAFFAAEVWRWLTASIVVTAASELAFTSYVSVYGYANMGGHLLKLIAVYLLYRAIIESGLRRPYNLLFLKLKRHEEALMESQRTLQTIFDHSQQGFMLLDRACRILAFNRQAAQEAGALFGKSLETGDSLYKFIPARETEEFTAHLGRCLAGECVLRERYFRLADGERWLRFTYRPVFSGNGQNEGICLNILDITEAKQAVRALQENEERYRQLFETMMQGVVYLRRDGQVFSANPAAERILGWSLRQMQEDANAVSLWRAIRQDGSAFSIEDHPTALALRSGEAVKGVNMGIYHPRENRYRWIKMDAIPLFQAGAHEAYAVYASFDEITAQREAETKLRALNEELEQRVEERTAALRHSRDELSLANAELARAVRLKDEFLANVNHELRTPLTGILGLSEAMQEQVYGPLNEKQLAILQRIEQSGRQLLALINDILDLTRMEAGRLNLQGEECRAKSICESVAHLVKGMANKKQQTLELSLEPEDFTFHADPRRLKQVLLNLLSNAVKFTAEGGRIGLKVRADEAEKTVRLSVWDNGIGIAAADMEHLFHPFTQLDGGLDREYTGAGLGLALVRRIVALHGGQVSVESAPGQGSRFTVSLPWR
jgi:PAS domain S-box-containing protein